MRLPHITGIKNNTRITLGEAFQNYCSPCHTGIKINTHITTDAPFTSARHTPTSRVLKLIPTLF